MIFLTVGTQLPFDRLTRAVDDWCAANPSAHVIGQIADPGSEGFRPQHFEWQSFIEPAEFDRRFDEADLIVAHAGMGSIITALTRAKPVLIMPRRANLREHRNDHQLATADRFADRPGVHVAHDEESVGPWLSRLLAMPERGDSPRLSPFASPQLLEAIRAFIQSS